jgi:hypothetical protein
MHFWMTEDLEMYTYTNPMGKRLVNLNILDKVMNLKPLCSYSQQMFAIM